MFALLWVFTLICYAASETVVETEYGPVVGYNFEGDLEKEYVGFLGIPYSKQPVGDLRFMPLEEPEPWTTPYNATNEAPMCIQRLKLFSPKYLQSDPIMSEACLGVNVYVPAELDEPLPVLVFFYGSAFNYLSSSRELYGPEYLVARDIIVVTANIRQNLWGYLTLDTDYAPGNNGLKDAFFLLEWVNRNIAAFGGDPAKVTLGGQSAGGIITHLLTLYPPAEGLFRSVIMQSGNALNGLITYNPDYAAEVNNLLFELLEIDSTDKQEAFDKLKAAHNESLAKVTDTLTDIYGLVLFSPTIESENENAIITSYPNDFITSKKTIDVPQLIGYTTDECLFLYYRIHEIGLASKIKEIPTLILPHSVHWNKTKDELPEAVKLFNETYFEADDDDEEILVDWMNMCRDAGFLYPTLRYAEYSAVNHESPTYLYQFSFAGKNNLVSGVVAECPIAGAAHLDDINYLWKAHFYEEETIPKGSIEELTKNRMVEMWTNFIKTGNPTPEVTDDVPLIWPPTDAETLTYLDINKKLSIQHNPYPDVRKFYKTVYGEL